MPAEIILETKGLTKEFKGFVAVNNVDLKVRRGDIHALIGPNGAGKTTFFNLLTKFLPPTRGTITYQGNDITQREAGADRAPRHRALVPDLRRVPAHDRAGERARRAAAQPGHLVPLLEARELAVSACTSAPCELLAEVDLQDFADELTVNLPYGRKRALELATTMALEPDLMLLDEPTQGMGHEDVHRVTQLIKKVSAGRTILMVEHNMNVVSSIADRITVLQRGAVIADGPYAEVSRNPLVIEAYMGTADAELQGAH